MTTTEPRLREFREARGWTQQDVAEQIARRVWGAVRFHRLRDFRASVQQWAGSAPVRQLDERLAVIA